MPKPPIVPPRLPGSLIPKATPRSSAPPSFSAARRPPPVPAAPYRPEVRRAPVTVAAVTRMAGPVSPRMPIALQRMEHPELPLPKASGRMMLRGVVHFLQTHCPGQWAFTGSFAIWLHASAQGASFRRPGDIDILVSRAVFDEVLPKLLDTGLIKGSYSAMTSKGWTTSLALNPSNSIDWIIESKARGALTDATMLSGTPLGTVPVLKLGALEGLKTVMAKGKSGQEKQKQASSDLDAMKALKK